MKSRIAKLFQDELFVMAMNATLGYIAMTAVILYTLQVPPEDILDSGLEEILLVFEG